MSTRPSPPTSEQLRELSAWRALALAKMPYMSHLVFSLRPLNAPGLGTFAVDPHHRLYVDFDEVASWGVEHCAEVLLHEVGHIFGEHHAISEDMALPDEHRRVMNVANDMSINDDLVQAGCATIAESGALPGQIDEPDYQTALHYYTALLNLMENQGQGAGQDDGGSGGHGAGDPTSGSGGQGDQDGDDGQGPAPTCGSGSGGQAAECELDADDDLGGAAPAASVQERSRLQIATAESITDHASRSRGTVPAGLVSRAEQVLTPSKTPWQKVLGSLVRHAVRFRSGTSKPSPTRRDRRCHQVALSPGRKVVYPGRRGIKLRIAAVRDTSGSMGSREIEAATSEIVAIAKRMRVRGKDLTVLDVDAEVHATTGYRTPSQLAKVHGRGGTDMTVGIDKAMQLPGGVDVIVVITDGLTPWPQQPPRVPVIACLVGEDIEYARELLPTWLPHVEVDS